MRAIIFWNLPIFFIICCICENSFSSVFNSATVTPLPLAIRCRRRALRIWGLRRSWKVIPQIIPSFLAVTIYWWDHNVRMSTVLGLVGGGGIGFLLIQYINLLQYNQAATVLWMIVIVVTVMDFASAAIRSRLV